MFGAPGRCSQGNQRGNAGRHAWIWLRNRRSGEHVVQISIFSMPRCLGSESPSRVSTGFCMIVVVFGFWSEFCFGFCSWTLLTCLWHPALQSGYVLLVSVMLVVLFLLFLLHFVLCFVVASPRGFASSFGVWEWESRRGAFVVFRVVAWWFSDGRCCVRGA